MKSADPRFTTLCIRFFAGIGTLALLATMILLILRLVGVTVTERIDEGSVKAYGGLAFEFPLRPRRGIFTAWVPECGRSRLEIVTTSGKTLGPEEFDADNIRTLGGGRHVHADTWRVFFSYPDTARGPLLVRYAIFPHSVLLGAASLSVLVCWSIALFLIAVGKSERPLVSSYIGKARVIADRPRIRPEQFADPIRIACVFVVVGALAYFMSRGFDTTDQGFALLSAARPRDAIFPSLYHWVLNWPVRLFGTTVVVSRIVDLSVHVAGGLVLGLATASWVKAANRDLARSSFWSIAAFVVLGSLAAYSRKVNTFSYNDIVSFGIYCATAGVLFGLAAKRTALVTLSAMLVGGGLGLTALGKPTSGFALGLLIAAASLPFALLGKIARLPATAGFVCGLAAVAIVFAFSVPSVSEAITNMFGGAAAFLDLSGHNEARQFQRLFVLVSDLAIAILLVGPIVWWVLFHEAGSRNFHRFLPMLGIAVAFVLFCVVVGYWPLHVDFGIGLSFKSCWYCYQPFAPFWFACVALILVWVSLLFFENAKTKIATGCLFLLLFLAPFAGAAGSNGGFVRPSYAYMATWFSLIIVISATLPATTRTSALSRGLCILLPLFAVTQTLEGYVLYPTRVNGTLLDQRYEVTGPPRAKGLLLDRTSKKGIEDAFHLLRDRTSFKDDDILLGLYEIPGLVYVLNGSSPGFSWYRNDDERTEFSCRLYAASGRSLEGAFLILTEAIDPKLLQCLRGHGLAYPEKYESVGSFQVLLFGHTRTSAQIYAPVASIKSSRPSP